MKAKVKVESKVEGDRVLRRYYVNGTRIDFTKELRDLLCGDSACSSEDEHLKRLISNETWKGLAEQYGCKFEALVGWFYIPKDKDVIKKLHRDIIETIKLALEYIQRREENEGFKKWVWREKTFKIKV